MFNLIIMMEKWKFSSWKWFYFVPNYWFRKLISSYATSGWPATCFNFLSFLCKFQQTFQIINIAQIITIQSFFFFLINHFNCEIIKSVFSSWPVATGELVCGDFTTFKIISSKTKETKERKLFPHNLIQFNLFEGLSDRTPYQSSVYKTPD